MRSILHCSPGSPTHSSFLLILTVGEGDVGELEVSLAVLEAPGHAPRGVTPLPQVALAEDEVVDVATVLDTDLGCDCRGMDCFQEVKRGAAVCHQTQTECSMDLSILAIFGVY